MASNKPEWLVVHHSASPLGVDDLKSEISFNNTHKSKSFPKSRSGWYIGYHWVIYSNGAKKQYRQDDEVGAHTKGWAVNFKSVGICLEGNFDLEEPSIEQKKALLELLSEYQAKYHIPDQNVVPHRYFATSLWQKNDTQWRTRTGKKPYKSCWGSKLPDDIIGFLKQHAFETPPLDHFAVKYEKFFMEKYGIKKKDLDSNASWGEFYVVLKRLYDDLSEIRNPATKDV